MLVFIKKVSHMKQNPKTMSTYGNKNLILLNSQGFYKKKEILSEKLGF